MADNTVKVDIDEIVKGLIDDGDFIEKFIKHSTGRSYQDIVENIMRDGTADDMKKFKGLIEALKVSVKICDELTPVRDYFYIVYTFKLTIITMMEAFSTPDKERTGRSEEEQEVFARDFIRTMKDISIKYKTDPNIRNAQNKLRDIVAGIYK